MQALAFRVDASEAAGTGHAMRCLALAQAWKDRGDEAAFLMAESLPAVDDRLMEDGIRVVKIAARPGTPEDARESADAARAIESRWIVLDGYRFDATYQEAMKSAGLSVLVIDDYGHAGRYTADIILNQNLHARPSMYRDRGPATRLLLGPRYALLRREFRSHRRAPRAPQPQVKEILVTVGGVNRDEFTTILLRGLGNIDGRSFHVTIVPGMGRGSSEGLETVAKGIPLRASLAHDTRDMAELMAKSDLTLAGAGTTVWELAYMGVPSLLVVLADNQRAVAASLDQHGAARNMGPSETLTPDRIAEAVRSLMADPKTRADMCRRARDLVDGAGVDRVLREMSLPLLTLRPVQEDDAKRTWEWSNEPGTRAASFSSDPILWEDHVRWFRAKLADPNCRFYVASDHAGRPIGQIRFDVEGVDAEVSISLGAEFRGHGYGAALIRSASQKLFDESAVGRIHAYLKEANEASARAFLDAGYVDRGFMEVRARKARHFVL